MMMHRACTQALARLSDKAIAEWTPFAITLAQRFLRLVKGGVIFVGHPLWGLILDGLLMRLVDTDVQASDFMCCL